MRSCSDKGNNVCLPSDTIWLKYLNKHIWSGWHIWPYATHPHIFAYVLPTSMLPLYQCWAGWVVAKPVPLLFQSHRQAFNCESKIAQLLLLLLLLTKRKWPSLMKDEGKAGTGKMFSLFPALHPSRQAKRRRGEFGEQDRVCGARFSICQLLIGSHMACFTYRLVQLLYSQK